VRIYVCMILLCASLRLIAFEKVTYTFTKDPIDVVIPCHKKDKETLDRVIDGVRRHIKHRSIILIAAEPFTDKALWCDEAMFPFTKEDISLFFFDSLEQAKSYMQHPQSRIGWIYQQLLKLYAPLVIPGISPNVLVVDADTIFMKSVTFQDEDGAPYFNTGTEYNLPYFMWMDKVIPGLKKVFSDKSGICHHMLLQRSVLEDLFRCIEEIHHEEPWKVFLRCMQHPQHCQSGMSEYELYFNYIFSRTDQAKIRPLRWANLHLGDLPSAYRQGLDYASCHAWMRTWELYGADYE